MAMLGTQMDDALKQKLINLVNPNHTLIMKMEKNLLILDQEHENISLDDLRNKIPENEPRIIAYPYHYRDTSGALTSYKILIFVSPDPSPGGCSIRTLMAYAFSVGLVKDAMLTSTSLEILNKNDLTEQWVKNQLAR
ncbi:glia maturation factor gamma [Hippocampus comes]|uniref:glia maturation factor gamma n=1 Tax=Hippocampus comes TaxID=109280 RepID=UPI00094E006B|nr:PREDICTED: glia maturation factor beta-like [Hippocampus comes]